MCRVLCVKSDSPFPVGDYLRKFAAMARASKEFQGHGYGFAWWENNSWKYHHSLSPIWEDDLNHEVVTTMLVVHARSAFENRDIDIRNNMPFTDEKWVFAFNGELRGVRISAEGRIGAEKIFNLIKARDQGRMQTAIEEAMRLLEQRSAYLKAANLIVTDGEALYLASRFNEDPDYYTMRRKVENDRIVICSEPLDHESNWEPIPQGVEKVA